MCLLVLAAVIAPAGPLRAQGDGSLDASFDPGAGPNDSIYDVAVQADGKIVVGGPFTTFNGVARPGIARLNADGSLDNSFDPGSGVAGGSFLNFSPVDSVVAQADGKIVLVGNFATFNGVARNRIARLNTNGSVDPSFDPGIGVQGGASGITEVTDVAVQADGKIVLCGRFTTFNGVARPGIARLNADGSLDVNFDPGSFFTRPNGPAPSVGHVAIQADGKIVLTGDFTAINGVTRNLIARLNTNGSLDTSFDPGSGVRDIYDVVVQSDGKIVLGGEFTTVNGVARSGIARLNTDGSVDISFDPGTGAQDGVGATYVSAVAVQANGKIVLVGDFATFNGVGRNKIARLNADGSLDNSFDPGSGANGNPGSVAVQAGGKIILAGSFSEFNGVARNLIARLNGSSAAHPPFFNGEVPLSNGVYYLAIPNSTPFGYYAYLSDPRFIYHFDMGYLYWFDAQNSDNGIFLYDFTSQTFFYTSPSPIIPFPFLYDFSLKAVIYYFPDPNNPGRYNTNGVRYFYNTVTGQIFVK